MSRSKKKRRNPTVAPAQPPRPSAFARYIVRHLFAFNLASAALFLVGGALLLSEWTIVQERVARTPAAVTWIFLAVWIASTLYRAYLNRTRNPQLQTIILSDQATRSYAYTQVLSTLLSHSLAMFALIYLTGVADPIIAWASERWSTLSPTLVTTLLSGLGALLWNLIPNVVWDLIKWLFTRKTAKGAKVRS